MDSTITFTAVLAGQLLVIVYWLLRSDSFALHSDIEGADRCENGNDEAWRQEEEPTRVDIAISPSLNSDYEPVYSRAGRLLVPSWKAKYNMGFAI